MKSAIIPTLKRFALPAVLLLILNFIYFYPSLQGKVMTQDDITMGIAKSKELIDYREATGEEAFWTNSMFSGMPTFQISTLYPNNWLGGLQDVFIYLGGAPDSIYTIALLMLGFYFLMLAFKVNPWVGFIGAIAFGFSAFFIISLSAGHISKVRTAAYMAPLLLGIILAYRGKLLAGFALTAVFLGLSIKSGHYQITFYTAIIVICIAVAYGIEAVKNKTLPAFIKQNLVLAVALVMAIGPNFGSLWSTYSYTKETIRGGGSELSHKQDASDGGLDFDYAMSWSYGMGETFNLLVPNLMGGGAKQDYQKTQTYDYLLGAFKSQGMGAKQAEETANQYSGAFMYWGDQSLVNGGYYVGAIAIFFFVLGLMLTTGVTRNWAVAAIILSLFLAWGKNFEFFNKMMFDYVPLFNKFRVPSMALVISFFVVPFIGILGLDKIIKGEIPVAELKKKLLLALYIVGGLVLALALLGPALFSFDGGNDENLIKQGFDINMLMDDRKALLRNSAFTSLFFIVAAAAVLWFYIGKKIKMVPTLALLAVLVIFDMWMFDKDQLGANEYVSQREYDRQFAATDADNIILKDTDIHYRVLNTTANLTSDSYTSYYHKSIGGYHGAKLIRYQDLIENQLAKNNIECYNMLNAKWYLVKNEQSGSLQAIPNVQACGNAWAIDTIIWADNANDEMDRLTEFKAQSQVVIDKRYKDYIGNLVPSSAGTEVTLTKYDPKNMQYKAVVSGAERFVVFSEIFYEAPNQKWQAYIDGKPVDHIRVNYTLRGLKIPVGTHDVVFKFEPETYFAGEKVDLVFSILLFLAVGGAIYFEFRNKKSAA